MLEYKTYNKTYIKKKKKKERGRWQKVNTLGLN